MASTTSPESPTPTPPHPTILTPTTHSYNNSEAPSLNITLSSHHPSPITIFVDNLSPAYMLKIGAFTITTITGAEIHQVTSTGCRIPPNSKVIVTLDEDDFHTLLPNVPMTLSRPFTRHREGGKPLAKNDPEYLSHMFAKYGVHGVDGLEVGGEYVLGLKEKPRVRWDHVRWWEYGTKEEVLGKGLDGRKVRYGKAPHEAIVVDRSGFEPVRFSCVE